MKRATRFLAVALVGAALLAALLLYVSTRGERVEPAGASSSTVPPPTEPR